ncbi:MAG TPA: ribosomal subunit interface protein [Rhodobacteraceae bacterium]|nr:ribosomal subunit interface protein [Paracoccaceae bacterium]
MTMQVILHNHDAVHGFESAQEFAEDVLNRALKGKLDRLTRVEIWVSDENSHKGGADDKRCSMEAHPKGRKPVGVKNFAADIPAAIRGAATKLSHALEHELHKE